MVACQPCEEGWIGREEDGAGRGSGSGFLVRSARPRGDVVHGRLSSERPCFLVYGAMMEPLSVAVHAISNVGQLRTGQTVLIMGAGPVGLLAMGVAKGLGAGKIVAVDINEDRLNFAKDYAATHIYIPVSDCAPRPARRF